MEKVEAGLTVARDERLLDGEAAERLLHAGRAVGAQLCGPAALVEVPYAAWAPIGREK